MFFTVGKIGKQLKEIIASMYRERRDVLQFKYIESDWPAARRAAADVALREYDYLPTANDLS